ncbi:MAG: glycosyltransferase [Symploca sp. SIO2E6]|nr:glycosyltransferase [Symploca sp. SIO2E6]
MPLISVIIPVYNGEQTIRQTIESVLNQTFRDFELIVINDGSQDSTLKIVESIQDYRLQLCSYPNAGLAASRNRGISLASGEYVSCIDADDLWTPDKLEAQLKVLQENPQAALAYSWTDWIDEAGKFLRPGVHLTITGDVYGQLLLNDFVANGSNPLIRKQALREVGGFDESLPFSEDWDMWLRIAAHYHFVAVPAPQILYRQSTNSMSCNVWGMETASLQIIERAFNRAPDSLKHLKQDSLGNRYKYLLFKALEGLPQRQRAFAATRLLWEAVGHDPSLLGTRVIWKVLLKIVTVILLPPKQAQALFTKLQNLFNVKALLVHFRMQTSA